MSIYQKITAIGSKFIGKPKLFKHGFNLSPMYRRSTARITEVSSDLLNIRLKLPISYRNKNYVNSIFGGSMFAAVDPIPMIQLMHLLGDNYVVWDKSAEIFFKRPAKEDLYAEFCYTIDEIELLKAKVSADMEVEIIKNTSLTSKNKEIIYCQVNKTIYVADKTYYKKKRANRKNNNPQSA